MGRLVVVGLDGVPWSVVSPLIEKGVMPVLGRLVREGVKGILESTIPPVTGASWLSFATGLSPGKTGVYDFLYRCSPRDFRLKPVTSALFKGRAVWDLLSLCGFRVGVVAFPMLYPPYEVNGFMVSGMGAPRGGRLTYPPELEEELLSVVGSYEVSVEYHREEYEDVDLFLRDINRFIDKQFRAVLYLLEKKEWDFFIYVCSATDWFLHRMWKYIDCSHPEYREDYSVYRRDFEEFFRKIDCFLGEVVSMGDNVMVVSDHGFGPQWGVFNLAKWLEVKGYMVRRSGLASSIRRRIHRVLSRLYRPFKKRKMFVRGVSGKIADKLYYSPVDFSKSKAFCLGHTIPFGAIYINPDLKRDRRLYCFVRESIKRDLLNLGRELGKDISVEIYEPDKLYSGDKLDLAPDIIFSINGWSCVVVEDKAEGPIYEERCYSSRHSGSHRLDGIFVAWGRDFKRGFSAGRLKIYDVAPTILHLFGIPVLREMDGAVVMDIFSSDSACARSPPVYVEKLSRRIVLREKIKRLRRVK